MDNTRIDELLSLGGLEAEKRDFRAAAEYMREAVELDPGSFAANFNLGLALRECFDHAGAAQCFKKTLELSPGHAQSEKMLGMCFLDMGMLKEALNFCRSAVKKIPDDAQIWNCLGLVMRELQELDAARGCFEKAAGSSPDYLEAQGNLAEVLHASGDVDAALGLIREMLLKYPDNCRVRSNYLFWLHYSGEFSGGFIYQEHVRLGKDYQRSSDTVSVNFSERNWEKRDTLRIGYVSPDFKNHSVAWFFEPLLENSGRAIENFCYSNVDVEDDVTGSLRRLSSCFRDISKLSDRGAAEVISKDRIDILVDLAGHTRRNRLGIFVLRPAPVQMTYLGYPDTTGLEAVDYRVSDAVADPPGSGKMCAEKLVRLPGCFLCYKPPAGSPAVSEPPAVKNGYVTFGSFNNISKITDSVIEIWAEVLKQTSGSKLLIKNRALESEKAVLRLRKRFERAGIAPDRLTLRGFISSADGHLGAYNGVDISLDTFPYNGTTTTCESLWMGVPVITMYGERHSARVGASILSSIGLDEFCAKDSREYVEKTVEYAFRQELLSVFRRDMRETMVNSKLCDGPGFVSSLESEYRKIWSEYCAGVKLPKNGRGEG